MNRYGYIFSPREVANSGALKADRGWVAFFIRILCGCVRACVICMGVAHINFVYFINKLCGVCAEVWEGQPFVTFSFWKPRPRSTQVATLVSRFSFQPALLRVAHNSIFIVYQFSAYFGRFKATLCN